MIPLTLGSVKYMPASLKIWWKDITMLLVLGSVKYMSAMPRYDVRDFTYF